MGKSKALSLAVSAIQNLKQIRGSTSRDILNFVTKAYSQVDQDAVAKQVQASLKRGVAYGILKRENGYYTFPIDTEIAGQEIAAQEIGLIEMCSRKRTTGRRNNSCQNRRCRKPDCRRQGRNSCPCSNGCNSSVSRKKKYSKKEPKSAKKNTNSKNVDKLFGETFHGLNKKKGDRI